MKRTTVPPSTWIGPFSYDGWLYQFCARHVVMKSPNGVMIIGRYWRRDAMELRNIRIEIKVVM